MNKPKFKIGDIVKVVACDGGGGGERCKKDCIGKVVKVIAYDSTEEDYPYRVEERGFMHKDFREGELKLRDESRAKPKPVKFIVGWRDGRDQYRTFTEEKEMKAFLKELSAKTSVEKDSVEVFEIKSHSKVTFTSLFRLKKVSLKRA